MQPNPEFLIHAIASGNTEMLKYFSKLIAMSVRNEMEDFHHHHLSDAQMKELNPLIRNGIYSALFAIANYNKNMNAKQHIDFQAMLLPSYWEDPELHSFLTSAMEQVQDHAERLTDFSSPFLKKEYELGNLILDKEAGCIRVAASFEMKGVDYDDRKKHQRKITAALKKEGYIYNFTLDGYIKRVQ